MYCLECLLNRCRNDKQPQDLKQKYLMQFKILNLTIEIHII